VVWFCFGLHRSEKVVQRFFLFFRLTTCWDLKPGIILFLFSSIEGRFGELVEGINTTYFFLGRVVGDTGWWWF
jgi:hypothetical protein